MIGAGSSYDSAVAVPRAARPSVLNQATRAPGDTDITRELSRLSNATEALDVTVGTMAERLAPVLVAHPTPNNADTAEQAPTTQLGDRIRLATRAVERANEALRNQLSALAI